MNFLVYVPINEQSHKLIRYLPSPAAEYYDKAGHKIGLHWWLNPTAIEKLEKRFGLVFQVYK